MSTTPTFTATVRLGLLALDQPRAYTRHVAALEGQRVTVTVARRGQKRSDAQNRAWWGITVPAIAEHLGYDRHEYEMVHYALVAKCFGTTVRDGIEVPNARSSRLTTAQFAELMEWAVRFAATEWGLVIPLPNEPDLEAA